MKVSQRGSNAPKFSKSQGFGRELSRTVVYREICTEVSETAKVCTDPSTGSGQAKQEVHKRHS